MTEVVPNDVRKPFMQWLLCEDISQISCSGKQVRKKSGIVHYRARGSCDADGLAVMGEAMRMQHEYYEKRAGRYPGMQWIINYDVERALHNYHYLAAQMADNGEPGWPRVFASRDCAAIVIANAPLDAIRDPHVMAWRSSFFELRRFDFLQRTEECLNGARRFLGDDTGAPPGCTAA